MSASAARSVRAASQVLQEPLADFLGGADRAPRLRQVTSGDDDARLLQMDLERERGAHECGAIGASADQLDVLARQALEQPGAVGLKIRKRVGERARGGWK